MRSFLARCSLALVVSVSFIGAAAPSSATGGGAAEALAGANAMLAAGKGAEAMAKAKEGLEYAPEDFELLNLASRIALSLGSTDEALWYGDLALASGEAINDKKQAKALAELRARLSAADPLGQRSEAVLREYANAILELGADCARRKLPVTAVGLLTRLRDTSAAERADAELAKIYGNKKAVQELLDSGVDVPAKPRKKRSARTIAFEDSKHTTWKTAHEIRGDQYTIKTNMGIELAESFSHAMEQINRFYRKVFRVKEGGGDTGRITVCVYRSRAEFDEHERIDGKPVSPTVRGFFSPGEFRVATYDPREEGGSLADLWSTLFHEASHQFTHIALTGDNEPTWLNEGTASYFEGARYLANGTVECNLVADRRLSNLVESLGAGRPSLTEVVQYNVPGSYPGEYYPFGWGLVYFLHNFENAKSERVYVQPYIDFMATYKEGRKHDLKERFVEYFVTRAKQPGVKTFADFEKRWIQWILDLHRQYTGSEDVATELIERARKQRADKQDESAIETYAWALRKRPGDPVAYRELAELLAARKKVDAALHNFRMAIQCTRDLVDPTQKLPAAGELTVEGIANACADRMQKVDEIFADALRVADDRFIAACTATAKDYADAKLPHVALQLLADAPALYGRSAVIASARAEIEKHSGADVRRWRRLPVVDDLEDFESDEGWKADGETLVGHGENERYCTYRADLPESFRFEARLDRSGLDAESGFLALVFGDDGSRFQLIGIAPNNGASEIRYPEIGAYEEKFVLKQSLPELKDPNAASCVIAIEVRRGEVEFFVDQKSMAKRAYDQSQLTGRIGFMAQNGTARFSDVRVRW